MNQEIALRWAEALESGDYAQGYDALRVNRYDDGSFEPVGVGYCCLGVLCDVSGLGEWNEDNMYLGCESFLPSEVAAWAGIAGEGDEGDAVDPVVPGPPVVDDYDVAGNGPLTLSKLNDREPINRPDDPNYPWDFRRIAALIRERWAEL